MAQCVVGSLSGVRRRAREGTRRIGQSPRRRDRVRGAESQSAPRRHAGADRRDRRTDDRPRRREGDHQREARRAGQGRRHRGLRHGDDPSALVRPVIDAEVHTLATQVLAAARARKWMIATAESCTGGLVAGALTEIAGASDVVDRGFVTYSNQAKMALVGVPETTLTAHGAVSRQTAEAMAKGALERAGVDVIVAITG